MKALTTTLAFALTVTAVFAAFAAAATLALGTTSLAAGDQTVTSCGVTSLSATRDVDNSGNVTQVNVSGISAACAGETLSVTLVGSGAGVTAVIDATSASLTGFGTVSAANVTGYAFAIEGA
jgi:hypothetical protein